MAWDGDKSLMQRTRWELGIFGHYFRQFVKTRLAYRLDFLVDTMAVSFALLVQLAT